MVNAGVPLNSYGTAKNLEITKPGQEIIVNVNYGDSYFHNNGKPLDLKNLTIQESPRLQYFPRNLHKQFRNLEQLYFVNCGIKEISKQDLRGLKNLKCFRMTNGCLTSLPDDLFTDMPNLIIISFDNNQIEAASSNLLKPFIGRPGLLSVELRGNRNIDAFFYANNKSTHTYKSLEQLMNAIDEKCKKPVQLSPTIMEAEDFNQEIKKLWISGKFSDFKIVSGDKEFNVHRTILAMRSPVMAEIFEDHKNATELQINDFSPVAVESLLHFIYTNENINEDNAREIFDIADKFKMQKMKSTFKEIISDNLKESNAYETFLFAVKHEAKELKREAFKVIADNFPDPLPESLMEDPGKLEKIIAIRTEYQKLLYN